MAKKNTKNTKNTKTTKTTNKKQSRYNISAEDFIALWNSSPNIPAVVEAITNDQGEHPSHKIVSMRASQYRKANIPMKTMPRGTGGGASLDVEALTATANKALASAAKAGDKQAQKALDAQAS